MKIAEKLYTQGLISYPRTETNMFPKEFDLRTLVGHQTQDQNWGGQEPLFCLTFSIQFDHQLVLVTEVQHL